MTEFEAALLLVAIKRATTIEGEREAAARAGNNQTAPATNPQEVPRGSRKSTRLAAAKPSANKTKPGKQPLRQEQAGSSKRSVAAVSRRTSSTGAVFVPMAGTTNKKRTTTRGPTNYNLFRWAESLWWWQN
jgi:hypothetical protein